MAKYILYPNGFVGSDSVEMGVEEAEQVNMHMKVGLFKTKLSDTKEKKYCKMTEVFYNKYFGKDMSMSVLTELMRIAYKHIGDSPLLWLKRHNDIEYTRYGAITKYHAEYLCETIAFAALGEVRRMPAQSWQKYLSYGTDDSSIGSSTAYKRIVANSSVAKINTLDFLAYWLARPNGQQDILLTLKMMYGKTS